MDSIVIAVLGSALFVEPRRHLFHKRKRLINMVIVILLLFIFPECTVSDEHNKNISNLNYKIISETKLIENDSLILISINKLIQSGNKWFVFDKSDSKAVIYNSKGDIIDLFRLNSSISDSGAIYGMPSRFGDTSITLKEAYELPDAPNSIYSVPLSYYLLDMYKSGDEILFAMRTQIYAYNSNPDSNIRSKYYRANIAGVVRYNILNKNTQFHPFIDDNYIITQANSIYYDSIDNRYYIDCYGRRISGRNWVLAEYDSNFQVTRKLLELPVDYVESGCNYYLKFDPYITNLNNTLFVSFPYDEKIINLDTKEEINIPMLRYSNSDIFKIVQNNELRRDSILYYLYNSFEGLYSTKDANLILIIRKYYPDSSGSRKSSFEVLEINEKSGLIKTLKFGFNNHNGSARCFTFSKEKNSLFVARKSNEGWTIEEIPWEE